jgi:hypothetical protein
MRLSAFIISLLFWFSCNTSHKEVKSSVDNTPPAPEADAIKKAVADAYKAISFKQGQPLNYNEIKNYFMPQAQLLDFRNDTLESMTIDQFVNMYKEFIQSNGIHSFYEEEIKGTTDQFGRIAQRMSAYKTYINSMDSVAQRGINSFQLIKTPGGWKVSSIIWDVETQKLKIPDYYLKADTAQ